MWYTSMNRSGVFCRYHNDSFKYFMSFEDVMLRKSEVYFKEWEPGAGYFIQPHELRDPAFRENLADDLGWSSEHRDIVFSNKYAVEHINYPASASPKVLEPELFPDRWNPPAPWRMTEASDISLAAMERKDCERE